MFRLARIGPIMACSTPADKLLLDIIVTRSCLVFTDSTSYVVANIPCRQALRIPHPSEVPSLDLVDHRKSILEGVGKEAATTQSSFT